MKYKLKDKLMKTLCLRFHRKLSCTEIGRKEGISRQAVSAYINTYLDKFKHKEVFFPNKCKFCKSNFVNSGMIAEKKRFIWKRYSPEEETLILRTKTKQELLKLAKNLDRTKGAILMKCKRLKI